MSTHIGNLNITGLPSAATLVRCFHDIENTSLVSVGQLCDANCTAVFTSDEVHIYHNGTIIISGHRSAATNKLWELHIPNNNNSLANIAEPTQYASFEYKEEPTETANNAVQSATPAEIVAFAHAALFSPVLATLMLALRRNWVHHFPGLTARSLKKHPPNSIATAKGHMDQSRQGKQSTKQKGKQSLPFLPELSADEMSDLSPEPPTNGKATHWCCATIWDTRTGKVFTDQTGRFIIPSSTGSNYLFVFYDYDSNTVHADALPNREKSSILQAFKKRHNMMVSIEAAAHN